MSHRTLFPNTDFLSKPQCFIFRARPQLDVAVDVTPPAVVFGSPGKWEIVQCVRDWNPSETYLSRDHCLGSCTTMWILHQPTTFAALRPQTGSEGSPLSRRYQGDPNPRRIRIPKDSEERVFDADFLSKYSFFRARQQLEVPIGIDIPNCCFGFREVLRSVFPNHKGRQLTRSLWLTDPGPSLPPAGSSGTVPSPMQLEVPI